MNACLPLHNTVYCFTNILNTVVWFCMIIPFGPLINAAAIITGGLLGMAIGSRLPERVREIVFQGLGLCTLVIGMQMALQTKNPLFIVLSLLLGGILGALVQLEDRFMASADALKRRLKSANPKFTEGFVNATVLFCIGAMAILGSLDEGLRGDLTIVLSKSVMDAFAAMALASVFGLGVIFAAVPVLLYQASMVMGAEMMQPWISDALLAELTATGGVLILGIGFNVLNLMQIKLTNMLPSLIVVIILVLVAT